MYSGTNEFQILFKKYRLKAEFSTLSELGFALAEKGLIYEDSIFSHWQKGSRIPARATILKLIEIFTERQSIKTLLQANEFLASAGEGYLTEKEAVKIRFNDIEQVPFQVPNQTEHFTGRQALIKRITKEIIPGNVLLIYGTPGVGKSALAIHLGYLLKNKFPDGVLWYRLDTSDVMDILLSIAFAFGKDIGYIQDKEIRASTVRSIFSNKRVLLIFDNVELKNEINLLLPNNKTCSVIITSSFAKLPIPSRNTAIHLKIFTKEETFLLYKEILGDRFITKNRRSILKVANMVGFLPLALHIFAHELKRGSVTIKELLEELRQELLSLQDLSYGDKDLQLAINFSFELLDYKTKKVFLSLAVFDGKDFPLEAVSYINDLSIIEAKKFLNIIKGVSLIEQSAITRYRIHPMIKKFVREKLDNPIPFLKAAKYYIDFFIKYDKAFLKSYPNIKQESDNVIFIFKRCYKLHYWDEVIALWDPLELLLNATNQLSKMRYLFQIVKTEKTGINKYQKMLIIYFCFLIIYWIILYFSGLKRGFWNDFYSFSFSTLPLIGGMIGFLVAKSWGLLKTLVGRGIFFLSIGLITWGTGGMIWAYYNFFLNNPAPYPSLADFGYIPSYLLWTIGMIYLPHAIGGKSNLRKKYGKLFFLIPLVVFTLSYYLVVFITKNTLVFAPITSYIKLFFDIAYPASDVIILTTVLVLGTSFKFFGGKYKLAMYAIILGFCFQYIADFLFSYVTTVNKYYNGGITDLFFTVGMSLVTFGILGFYFRSEKKLKL